MSEKIILSEEQISEIETLGSVLSIDQLADYFGIGRTTIYNVFERQPEALEQYKIGKSKAIKNVGTSLIMKAMAGDVGACAFYLKTQAGWKEKHEVTLDGDLTISKIVRTIVDPANGGS